MWADISVWLWFASPWRLVMLNTFCVPVGHLYAFFGKMSIQILWPIFKIGFLFSFFFAIESCEYLMYFGNKPLIRYMIFRHFLPFYMLLFHFLNDFLCCAKVLYVFQTYSVKSTKKSWLSCLPDVLQCACIVSNI